MLIKEGDIVKSGLFFTSKLIQNYPVSCMKNFLVAEGVGPMSGGSMAAWPITAQRNLREQKTSQFKVKPKY